MNFNTEELYVLRSYLALGQEPTLADLEDAFQFNNIHAFSRDLVSDNTQTNEAFVTGLYENLLDRTPGEEEVQWWAEQMDQGLRSLTKAQIMLAFQDAAASEDGGVANAKVEALGLETIGLEFGTGQDDDNGDVEEPVDVEFDLAFEESASVNNNMWSIGREAIDAGQATLSNEYTLSLSNQLNENNNFSGTQTDFDINGNPVIGDDFNGVYNIETYNAYFLSPLLSNIQTSTTQSELVLEVIDRHAETNEQALEFMAVQSFNFFYDDENIVVSSEDILNASTYKELRDAIAAALAADGRGDDFNVRLGETFERQQTHPDTQEFTNNRLEGTGIIIEATGDGEMVRGGFETGAKPNANKNIDPAARMTADSETSKSTTLISTNVELQNIGYGSQGARLNVSGQSHSDVAIQELKIDAQSHAIDSLGVWLTSLSSNPYRNADHEGLERVVLSGSSPYFNVGVQDGEEVVATEGAGLVDVREFAASGFGGNIQLDATITSDIIARDFDLVDTDGDAARDNVPAQYDLGRKDDRLLMEVAVEALAHEDFALNINTGAGDDYVHLKLSGEGDFTVAGDNQFANHVARDNVNINASSGSNTIWTEGAGKATVTTGGGRDTIYTDNSANQGFDTTGDSVNDTFLKAHWVLNAQDTNVQDLLGRDADSQLLLGAQVRVTLSESAFGNAVAGATGLESLLVDIPVNSQGMASQAQVNQAIKKAINEDDVLSKLLVAKDGPNDTLVIESLIDGEFSADNLKVEIIAGSTDEDDANFIGTNAVNQLAQQLRADSATPNLNETQVQTELAAGAAAMQSNYGSALGTVGSATPAVPGTAATAVLDISGLTFNGTAEHEITGDLTIAATAYATAADLATVLEGLTDVASASVNGTGIDIVFEVQDAAGANPGFAFNVEEDTDVDGTVDETVGATVTAGTTGSAGGGAGVAIEGANSDAESFVTVDAGSGQDVVVLSTSADAEETVVFTGNFSHNTIVNFGANGASDTLDFTSYLNARTSVSESEFSAVTPAANITTAGGAGALEGALNSGANSVINFTALQYNADNTWDNLSASALQSILNGGEGYGIAEGAFDTDNLEDANDLYSTSNKAVVFIENGSNEGEYKVFEIASSEDSLDSVTLIGTVDFGASIGFTAANFEGVA